MTRRIKHYISLKKGIYRRMIEETRLRGRNVELVRAVKSTRLAKRNYEVKVDKETKSNPKGHL